ncbi:MAG: amylo-alpha-1,6-glucosidase [Acidobacteriales bacterium]|nr:amylo-alpha-1,6-glucosidase [Terriglobales bacterium]
MFGVFDRYGDIEPSGLGEQGIFYQGTRYLSEWVLHLWNSRPLLLSSTVKDDNFLLTADLANVDVYHGGEVAIPRDTIHVLRSKFLRQGVCYEEFRLVNYGLSAVTIPVRIAFGADYADIFEVRGTQRERRGERLPDEVGEDSVTLVYQGLDDVLRRTRIRCQPTPEVISTSELCMDVHLEAKRDTVLQLSVVCNPHDNAHAISYATAAAAAQSELKSSSSETARVRSSNDRFNRWAKRSQADIEMMALGNPETGYPYAGVPWFSTVFGRDGIITALQTLWMKPAIAGGVLQYLADTQAHETDPQIEAEPGKILHEMRRGEMAALGEVPFGRYYGTVDATPLFVMLAEAYYQRTGDRSFIQEMWPHIDLALTWCDKYGDLDGDGFVEYARQGRKGLIQQGWKDSNDSVFHADGALAKAPIALCEVQGYVYAAKTAAARLCTVLGNHDRAIALEAEAYQLQGRFEDAFWCADISSYALALDGDKRPCRVRASNAGHCLYTGIAGLEHARLTSQTLLGDDFFTGWGVRTIGSGEARYNPISYHNGSVWPHDNGLVASGLARYGFKELAGQIMMGLMDVSSAVELHRLPELFCGIDRRHGDGPTLYPVACSPQAWAAGAVFMLVQACTGLAVEGAEGRIVFRNPYLPQGMPQLTFKGLTVGDCSVDVVLSRHGSTTSVEVTECRGGQVPVIVE